MGKTGTSQSKLNNIPAGKNDHLGVKEKLKLGGTLPTSLLPLVQKRESKKKKESVGKIRKDFAETCVLKQLS